MTIAVAGNVLGKDYVAGALTLIAFLTRTPCRIVTTSVDHAQLEGVLWGEIRNFVQLSTIPLESTRGGPLIINHLHIRQLLGGEVAPKSYLKGRTCNKGEGMLGHHVPRVPGVPKAFFIGDEASGLDKETIDAAETWYHSALLIGNPYPCANPFKDGVEAGDRLAPDGRRYYRKVIRIRAEDSPNVQLGLMERAAGRQPSYRNIVEGVLSFYDYEKRRSEWTLDRQSVGLDAQFWKGAELLLFHPGILNKAELIADSLRDKKRVAKAIGIDPAEGGDKTSMCAIDEFGVIEQVSRKTPNTNVIPGEAIAFMRKHNVPPEKVAFDRGGGGLEHADRLRAQGYDVQTIGFGETVTIVPRRSRIWFSERMENREERYVYVRRRDQMYGEASLLVESGFGIPAECKELRRQLSLIPRRFDDEGRMKMPPKRAKAGVKAKGEGASLMEIIGCSPDEADAFVLAVHAMIYSPASLSIGAIR